SRRRAALANCSRGETGAASRRGLYDEVRRPRRRRRPAMALPALVLVHGGGFAADCWEPTVDVIRSVEPELKVLSVDFPGRRNKAGDLITACIDGWGNSVVSDIENAALDDLVTVGPCVAGVDVPP